MRTQVLYHFPCYDGFGAAFAAWLVFGSDADYHPCNYGKPLPELPAGAPVRMIDFSIPREQLLAMKQMHPDLIVLDHHKTAQADLAGLEFCTFDMNRSGATLAYDYFQPVGIGREFFEYLEDRDLWRFKMPGSEEWSAAMRSFPFDFNVWLNMSMVPSKDLIAEGRSILRYQKQAVATMVDNARLVSIGNVDNVPAVNTCWLFSEVAHALLAKFPGAPFTVAWYVDGQGIRKYSLRSEDSRMDVSEVAKKLGGGGHRNAAGFQQ